MCGILAIFGADCEDDSGGLGALRQRALLASRKIRHRGPDWTGIVVFPEGHVICHERLAIVDPGSGAQPLTNNNTYLAANGEIYNYKELYAALPKPYHPATGSDCEVLIPMFEQKLAGSVIGSLNTIRGDFAFVMSNSTTKTYWAVRDHLGLVPLYIGV